MRALPNLLFQKVGQIDGVSKFLSLLKDAMMYRLWRDASNEARWRERSCCRKPPIWQFMRLWLLCKLQWHRTVSFLRYRRFSHPANVVVTCQVAVTHRGKGTKLSFTSVWVCCEVCGSYKGDRFMECDIVEFVRKVLVLWGLWLK
jgi:hypothetical protein